MNASTAMSAVELVAGLGSLSLEHESVQLAKQGLEYSQEALSLEQKALDAARTGIALDRKNLNLAELMHSLEKRSIKCAEESLNHSDQTLFISHTELTRSREWRLVEEKTQQLKAISNLSALIAGFAMVSLVELDIPADISPVLLILFGVATALVVCTMVLTMLTSSMLLVYILNYRRVTDQPFKNVWAQKCESDWRLSFGLFKMGVPCFLISLSCIAWIKFTSNHSWADLTVSICVTVVCVVSLGFWIVYVKTKYADREAEDNEEVLEPGRRAEGVASEKLILEQMRAKLERNQADNRTAPKVVE